MKRPATPKRRRSQRIRAWRAICPELTIRCTFIVGFPGETEQEFDELLELLEEAQLDRVGCFALLAGRRRGRERAAGAVPEEVKEERWHRFMATQQGSARGACSGASAKTSTSSSTRSTASRRLGRSMADAPEIDGRVYLPAGKGAKNIKAGNIVTARVTSADEYDLWAEPVG